MGECCETAEDYFGVFSQLADSAQVFVHWKQISSDDRFPILVKGLEADGSWKGGEFIIRWKHGNSLSWENVRPKWRFHMVEFAGKIIEVI